MAAERVLAVDPGREKCGVAVLDRNSGVLWRQIVPTEELLPAALELIRRHGRLVLVVGSQTHSSAVRLLLQPLLEQGLAAELAVVDEHGSTEEARLRYWRSLPPTGWRKFIPGGLLVPPCAIDDFAAIILGERYFKEN